MKCDNCNKSPADCYGPDMNEAVVQCCRKCCQLVHHDGCKPVTVRMLQRELQQMEKRLESYESTLRIIQTWATFCGGRELVPKHVDELISKTLE